MSVRLCFIVRPYWPYICSGNAFLNPGENLLVVDNLIDGFELYRYPHTAPFSSIEIPRKTPFVHGTTFLENGAQIACGSDHGTIYLFSVELGDRLQKLRHGSQRTMIQTLDVSYISTSSYFRYLELNLLQGSFNQRLSFNSERERW